MNQITRKKILIIPHHPVGKFTKIRLGEVAKFLAKNNEVYLLNWNAAEENYCLKNRIIYLLKDLFRSRKIYKESSLNIVEFPILHRPMFLVPRFNAFWLRQFIKKTAIDAVINGSYYMFDIKKNKDFRYIVDLADLPVINGQDPVEIFIESVLRKEIKKADAVTVVSIGLKEFVLKKYKCESCFIPNGADLCKIKSVKQEETERLRKQYGLHGKWIIGYIGFIGEWVDVAFIVDVFKVILKKMPDAYLLWVGASPDIDRLRALYGTDNITFTGGIKGDIEPYFGLLDLAMLPHKKCLFQDLAFHIKLIEYTAAKKKVISSTIKEVERLAFPNVHIADLEVKKWQEAIINIRNVSWDEKWNTLTDNYNWEKIGEMFLETVNKR